MTEPIIVVGPGRCGTSCVAQLLSRLGVFMGARLLGADPTNRWGHYEDREFLDLNAALLRGDLTRAGWSDGIRKLIDNRRALGLPWGWKDPRTSELVPEYLEFFNDPIFVRCTRSPEQIEASILKAYGARGWTPDQASSLRIRRERVLNRYLPWYRTIDIDFDVLRSKREEVVRSITRFCGLTADEEKIWAAIESVRPLVEAG